MNNSIVQIFGVFLACCFAVFLYTLGASAISKYTPVMGVSTHESGNAVYIAGEACNINATEDIGHLQFATYATWCKTQHKAYLDKLKMDQLIKE